MEVNMKFNLDIFRFSPDLIVSSYGIGFLSLTEWGRFRFDSQLKVKWEIFSNFYSNVTFYFNMDTRPPESAISGNDYGVIFGISYTP